MYEEDHDQNNSRSNGESDDQRERCTPVNVAGIATLGSGRWGRKGGRD